MPNSPEMHRPVDEASIMQAIIVSASLGKPTYRLMNTIRETIGYNQHTIKTKLDCGPETIDRYFKGESRLSLELTPAILSIGFDIPLRSPIGYLIAAKVVTDIYDVFVVSNIAETDRTTTLVPDSEEIAGELAYIASEQIDPGEYLRRILKKQGSSAHRLGEEAEQHGGTLQKGHVTQQLTGSRGSTPGRKLIEFALMAGYEPNAPEVVALGIVILEENFAKRNYMLQRRRRPHS